MEDFEFDQLYSDKMSRAKAPDFSFEDWEQLSARLESLQQRKQRRFPLLLLLLLSTLLLCSNAAWWWKWQHAGKPTISRQSPIQATDQKTVELSDTIWNKVVVNQYDTVYHTIVMKTLPGDFALANRQTAPREPQHEIYSNPGNLKASGDQLAQNSKDSNAGDNLSIAGGPVAGRSATALLPVKKVLMKMPAWLIDMPEYGEMHFEKKHKIKPLPVPRDIRVGLGGGLVMPAAKNLALASGFSTRLSGEIAFSESLAFNLDGEFIGVKFKGTADTEDLGLPGLNPPGDDYIVKYFEPHDQLQPILQLNAGMRYWFHAEKKWSPYLGVGYAAQWYLPFELEVEYINPGTGMEMSHEIDVPSVATPVSMLDINGGLRLRLSEHWLWQSGGTFQYKINNQQRGIPRFFGLKSVLLFDF